jgi:hypothetical protein
MLVFGSAPRATEWFAGRVNELNAIHMALTTQIGTRLAVTGLQGIGKSALCRKYLKEEASSAYTYVIWLDARTPDTFEASCAQAIRGMPIKPRGKVGSIASLRHCLAQPPGGWLLVLDNALGEEVLGLFIEVLSFGNTLLNSANGNIGLPQIELGALDDSIGAEVIQTRTGIRDPNLEEWAYLLKIAASLGGLPLALMQAGSFIAETHCSLNDCFKLLSSTGRQTLLEQKPNPLGEELPVTKIWQTALDGLSPEALLALKYLAILQEASQEQLLKGITPAELTAILHELRQHSFVQQQTGSIYGINPILAEVVRRDLNPTEEKLVLDAFSS